MEERKAENLECFYCVKPPRQTYLMLRNSSTPNLPPSRPSPDSLMPPNGASAQEIKPSLIPIIPTSNLLETLAICL